MAMNDLKTLIEERDRLSQELAEKERSYEAKKGHKFMRKEEFKA
jgi:hypothetical protein